MADTKALTPKSFRIDDETAQKFKEIANSIGRNQQGTMQLLLNAYYMQQGKAELSEHKANIEQFEAYTTSIITMYTQSLQANHDLRETVLQEMDATLKSKDSVIQGLQNQLTAAKQKRESAEAQAKALSEENKTLVKENETLKTILTDKDGLNKALRDSCNDLKSKIETLEANAGQAQALRGQLREIQGRYDDLLKKNESLESQMQQAGKAHEDALNHERKQAQLSQDEAILELKKLHQQEIQELTTKAQAELETCQKRYADLLLQLQGLNAAGQK